MNPIWKDGGLFYPRCDDLDTESYVTCVTGNALIGATRLVPKNGLSNLLNKPWTDRELALPTLSGIPYPKALVTRALSDEIGIEFNLEILGDELVSIEYHIDGLIPDRSYQVTTSSGSGIESCIHPATSKGKLTLPLAGIGQVHVTIQAHDN
jgi:hypothetical protein